jgi:ATP-dependent DNA ligase
MEARSVDALPEGDQWQYEPKWDGFRCLVFRDGDQVELQSKSGQPLERYFPDLVETLRRLKAKRFVLDGEIVIPVSGRLSFDELLLRIHPAESRVRKLAAEHPAMYVVFDLLQGTRGGPLVDRSLEERRKQLEAFAAKFLNGHADLRLSPATHELKQAKRWLKSTGGNLDGVIAKRLDLPYQSGNRDGMRKVKRKRTIDCVVGGFRYAEKEPVVGSLLLGLYDDEGRLNHVGFTSSFKAAERKAITERVEALIESPGFTGKAPGGPSRWSTRRSDEWKPLKPKLIVEVEYDHFTGGRFRHGTTLLRCRPDKAPEQCTDDQLDSARGASLRLLRGEG